MNRTERGQEYKLTVCCADFEKNAVIVLNRRIGQRNTIYRKNNMVHTAGMMQFFLRNVLQIPDQIVRTPGRDPFFIFPQFKKRKQGEK